MDIRSLLRNKGLVLAASLLVGMFLLFLFIISVIQANSLEYVRQSDAISSISSRFVDDLSGPAYESVVVDLARITAVSDVEKNALISLLSQGDVGAAKQKMQLLLKGVEVERVKKGNLAKYMQFVAAILSILFLLLVVFPLIARVAKQEDTEQVVRKETEGILGTVSEGLFLLTSDNEFGVEQSASLKEMFRSERDLEGDFFDFIGNYVPQSTIQVAKDYLGLLYGDRVKEKLVKDLNPLNEIEISIVRRDGSYENRYLNFKFNRVLVDGKLSHLLGSVTDVTREVNLQRELEESRDEQEAQLDLLMSILHIDSEQLGNFFETADSVLNEINNTLESKGYGDAEIRLKIKGIAEKTHGLKGDAAALGLHKFEFSAHALEDSISEIQKTTKSITGKQLLPAVTKLKDLFAELQNMRSLVTKFSKNIEVAGRNNAVVPVAADAVNDQNLQGVYSKIEQPLYALVDTVCERTNKRAVLTTYGFRDADIPAHLLETVMSSCVQFVRNSIVHGGLSPAERIAQGKSDYLNIASSFTETDEGYSLLIKDDGEGLDDERIIKRSVELGFIEADQVGKLPAGSAARMIFKSGFSVKEEADLDGGRGVGLNAVYSMITKVGGKISLRQKRGQYCQFQLFFPR